MGSCVNGASVKAGTDPATQVAVSRYLWEQVTGTPTSWLDPILDLFGTYYVSASGLCALNLNDPALPDVLTLAECLTSGFTPSNPCYQYVHDKLFYSAFASYCACNNASPCTGTETWTGTVTGTVAGNHDLTERTCTPGQTISGTSQLTGHNDANYNTIYLNVEWFFDDGSQTLAGIASADPAHPGPNAGSITVPANVHRYKCYAAGQGPTAAYTETGTVSYTGPGFTNCGTSPPSGPSIPSQPTTWTTPPVPTCGGSQDICNRLSQLDQRIQSVLNMVTLIQRQRVPFAYIQQAAQSISGSGVVAVQGILGVALALSDSRSGIGNYPDNPTTFFDLGWLSFCTADGCQDARQIRRHNDIFLDVNPATTSVRYSLPSGVSGTLIPLVREP